MIGYTRVHLVNHEVLEGEPAEMSDDQVRDAKDVLETMMSQSGAWQVNVLLPGNRWAIFPHTSILYVELVTHP